MPAAHAERLRYTSIHRFMTLTPAPHPASAPVPRPVLYLWITFVVVSALLWLSCLVLGHLGFGPPYSTPFAQGLFADLQIYFGRFETFHTAAFFEYSRHSHFAYPAGAAVIYQAIYATHRVRATYSLLCIGWALFGAVVLTRALLRQGLSPLLALPIAVSGSLAFPFLFLYQRGNIEIALWIIASLGILAYMRRRPYLAAVLWGIATAIKIYPVFLLGLFLGHRRREVGPLLTGIASALLTTVACLAYVGPSIGLAFRGFLGGVQGFQGAYAETVRSSAMGFDHSLFSPFKLLAVSTGHLAAPWLHPYYLLAGALAALVFLLRVRKLPFLNRLTFLTVCFILLPPVSYEYTLVHLYPPAALLFLYAVAAGQASPSPPASPAPKPGNLRSLIWALGCLLVLFLPINLFVLHGLLFAGQAQILPLLLLAALAAIHPWSNPSQLPRRAHAQDLLQPSLYPGASQAT